MRSKSPRDNRPNSRSPEHGPYYDSIRDTMTGRHAVLVEAERELNALNQNMGYVGNPQGLAHDTLSPTDPIETQTREPASTETIVDFARRQAENAAKPSADISMPQFSPVRIDNANVANVQTTVTDGLTAFERQAQQEMNNV